jgi:hypothetical protein
MLFAVWRVSHLLSVMCFSLQVRVKMVTADDEATTDIIVEGDREEITRLSKVRLTVTISVHLTGSSSLMYISASVTVSQRGALWQSMSLE